MKLWQPAHGLRFPARAGSITRAAVLLGSLIGTIIVRSIGVEADALPGMPSVVDPSNLYGEAGAGHMSPAVADALYRIYVPDLRSNDVYVVDPGKMQVVDRFKVGFKPQHVAPSWDLKTLWVTNNGKRGLDGSLTPIDPKTAKPGPKVMVADPYNLYFTPDGKSAIVVAERLKRLDFRDPHTMQLQYSLPTPDCPGIDHGDFSIDGRYAIFTCEFGGSLVKVDIANRRVLGYLQLAPRGAAQDIRVSPDGKVFYVADMHKDGVFLVDGDNFTKVGFIATGIGTHGLYPSRDGKLLYVTNRGSHANYGRPHGPGSVTVIDFTTRRIVTVWPIPGGGSPDRAMSPPAGSIYGLPDAGMTPSTALIRRRGKSGKFRLGSSRTVSAFGRSRVVIRSGIPGTCARPRPQKRCRRLILLVSRA